MRHHLLDLPASYYDNGGQVPQQLAGIAPPPVHSAADYETYSDDETFLLDSPVRNAPASGPSSHRHVRFAPDSSIMSTSSDHFSNPSGQLRYRDVIEEELSEDELGMTVLDDEFALAANHNEPNTYKQAMKTNEAPSW